ncbi:uncharacterized protein DS421_7g218500 [Arachis hypogaea]|nr:uncharacterized protein DS421_7g218500 [Arachis hypogaea]
MLTQQMTTVLNSMIENNNARVEQVTRRIDDIAGAINQPFVPPIGIGKNQKHQHTHTPKHSSSRKKKRIGRGRPCQRARPHRHRHVVDREGEGAAVHPRCRRWRSSRHRRSSLNRVGNRAANERDVWQEPDARGRVRACAQGKDDVAVVAVAEVSPPL